MPVVFTVCCMIVDAQDMIVEDEGTIVIVECMIVDAGCLWIVECGC